MFTKAVSQSLLASLLLALPLSACGRPAEAMPTPSPAAPTPAPDAHIFHVAPGGSDANPRTIDRPWATVNHGAETLEAGDTVYCRNQLQVRSACRAHSTIWRISLSFASSTEGRA